MPFVLFVGLLHHIFLYYQDLDAIWNGILLFDSKLVSFKLGINHTEDLLRIVNSGAKIPAVDKCEDNEMQEDDVIVEEGIGTSTALEELGKDEPDIDMSRSQYNKSIHG